MSPRPPIPDPLQRRVRQHCGYGCALCGRMPTQIEHIEPYSKVLEHNFENLVLLCLECHGEVTAGRQSKRAVLDARDKPFSVSKDRAHYSPRLGNQFAVSLGSVGFSSAIGNSFAPFSVNGIKPLKISLLDRAVVSLRVFDRSGSLAVSIVETVFQFVPSKLWDIRLSGTRLKVSYGMRKIVLDAEISNSNINFRAMRFSVDKFPIVVDKDGIMFPNTKNGFSKLSFDATSHNDMTFFSIGASDGQRVFDFNYVPSVSDKDAWDAALKTRR